MSAVVVGSPVAGSAMPLTQVPDPVFSQAMVGPGAAIQPETGEVEAVAPVTGRLVKLHPHAYVVVTPEGAGVLVHLGIDTVQLEGEDFTLLAAEDDEVSAGQPVIRWNAAATAEGGRSTVCPVIALDAAAEELANVRTTGTTTAGQPLFTWLR